MSPRQYVNRYMAGEGRGNSAGDREMQQYAANHAEEIEAEFARRAVPREDSTFWPVFLLAGVATLGLCAAIAALGWIVPSLINCHDQWATLLAFLVAALTLACLVMGGRFLFLTLGDLIDGD